MKETTRKKVLIIAGVFPPEPIVSANLYFDLAMMLSQDYDVTVLRPRPSRPAGFKMQPVDESGWPFKMIELQSYTCAESSLTGRFHESLSMGNAAVKYIKAHYSEIDFIYNDPWQIFGINKVARIAQKYNIPYAVPVQDIYPESLMSKLPNCTLFRKAVTALLMPIDRFNLRHASLIHTISDKMVEYLSASRGVARHKFIAVRNWQDESKFIGTPDVKRIDDDFIFMYMGNVGFLAGLDTVIDAFAMASIDGAKLIIAGSGAARNSLEHKVKAFGLRSIEFWDVPNGYVAQTQAIADVMLLPVKKGGAMSSIPSKLPAYMFSSKPILASVDTESDTAECIFKSNAGWVVEPENVEQLAKKMKEIANLDKQNLSTLGAQGLEFAMQNLSKKNNLRKLVDRLTTVINDNYN